MNRIKIKCAEWFAAWAHRGQVRKYTGEPYVEHTKSVARIVQTVPCTTDMVCAALLHDTVEDTWVRNWMIRLLFGRHCALLVSDLTDVSCAADGNRAVRKATDRAHTASAHVDAKTVKLADLIDNSESIVAHDEKFAKVFMMEKNLLIRELKDGDPVLYARARKIVKDYFLHKNG